jgi:hypothetical protein
MLRIDELLPDLISANDMLEYYAERMVEHRNNAIASRKRAEVAEVRVKELEQILESMYGRRIV